MVSSSGCPENAIEVQYSQVIGNNASQPLIDFRRDENSGGTSIKGS